MPIRGQKKRILLPPQVVKDLDPKDSLMPVDVDMRNLRITKRGSTSKRRGYVQKWDTTNDVPINALIPEGLGYSIDDKGRVIRLGDTLLQVGSVAPSSTPSWVLWDGSVYIWSGGIPSKITTDGIVPIGGNPVHAKFVAVVGEYMVVAGHDPTEFRWPVLANPDNWSVADGAGFANVEKLGTIQNMIGYKKHLLFFRERDIEVRAVSGGSVPFVINNNLHSNMGLLAPYSVVVASDDKVYWLGTDKDFYVMDNFQVRNLSRTFSREIAKMQNPTLTKGFDIAKEKHVKWVNQEDGFTFIYDYENDRWYEDNRWEGSGWQAFPMNSYMELDNKQYFGDINCTGLIHEIKDSALDDNGAEIRSLRQFAVQPSESGNRVRVNELRFRRKGGVGTLAETSPQILLEYRWDKRPFRAYPNLAQGAMGVNDPYISARNLGIGRELEIRITEMQDTDYIIQDAVITYEELRG
jgi:hypothetical protein